MDSQTFINTAIALIGALGGMVLKALWDGLAELRSSDKELADKVHNIENLVAGQYVKRDEFFKVTDTLFTKLDSINQNISNRFDTLLDRVDSKQDKQDCESQCMVERRK